MSEWDDYADHEPTPPQQVPPESSEYRVARLTLLVYLGGPLVVLAVLLAACGVFALMG
jgi:hypothetical protein